MALALRESVHFCVPVDRAVFLDGRTGRYFRLPDDQDEAFQRWFNVHEPMANDLVLLDKLAGAGLLVESGTGSQASPYKPVDLPAPARELDWARLPPPASTTVVRAIIDQLAWLTRLKLLRFSRALEPLCRNSGMAGITREQILNDILASVVPAFDRADFLLGSHDRCLVRSLALTSACRRMSFNPKLVIGVRDAPFSAHCWIQHEDMVINDRWDRVRLFTPILAT